MRDPLVRFMAMSALMLLPVAVGLLAMFALRLMVMIANALLGRST